MSDPATTIREALDSVPHRVEGWKERYRPALAALTELEQQLRTYKSATAYATDRAEGAERERDQALDREAGTSDALDDMRRERDQLAAEVERLTADRDERMMGQFRLQDQRDRLQKLLDEHGIKP